MKDFITAMKLIPFGLKFKRQIAFGIVFFIFGIVFLFLSVINEAGNSTLGGFYIAFSTMFLVQMVISTTLSNIVQTSPYKKKLQTLYPTLLCAVFTVFAYTIFLLLLLLRHKLFPNQDSVEVIESMLCVDLMLFACELYMATVYKYFIPSIIIVFLAIYAMMFGVKFPGNPITALAQIINYPAAVGLGYLILVLGNLAAYGLSNAMYKKDLDKLAFASALKKTS